MSLADEVRTLRRRVADRLAELEPLVREYEQLRQLADELGIAAAKSGSEDPVAAHRSRSQPVDAGVRAAQPAPVEAPVTLPTGGERRAGRRRGSGKSQSAERDFVVRVLEAVRENPGATVADLASIMDVPATSLYRPVRDLTGRRELVKRGRALFPAAGS
jgi:hypothetical protein